MVEIKNFLKINTEFKKIIILNNLIDEFNNKLQMNIIKSDNLNNYTTTNNSDATEVQDNVI